MASTVAIQAFSTTFNWLLSGTSASGTANSSAQPLTQGQTITYGNGAGVSAVNILYSTQLSIAASGTSSAIVLSSLTDPLGNSIAFAKIKIIFIQLAASPTPAASSITFQPGGTHPWNEFLNGTTPTITLNTGAFLTVGDPTAAGYAVVSNTHDQFTITNVDSVNTATVNIVMAGA